MATRTQKIKVGVFLLVGIVLIAGGLLLISGLRRGDRVPYVVRFDESVLGLAAGSQVVYLGVPIGSVENIRVGPEGYAIVNINVDPAKAIIHEGVVARLEIMSFATGSMAVALEGGDLNAPELPPYSEIPSTKSTIESVSSQIGDILENLNDITAQLDVGLNGIEDGELAEVVRSAKKLVDNADEFIVASKDAVTDLKAQLETTVERANSGLEKFENLSDDISQVADSMDEFLGTVQEKLEPVELGEIQSQMTEEFTQLAAELRAAAEALGSGTETFLHQTDNVEYGILRSLQSLNETLEAIREVAVYLKRDPSAIVFGRGREGAE